MTGGDGGSSDSDPDDPIASDDPFQSAGSGTAGAETRVVRLTHGQYENSVRDLFGVEGSPASLFAPDSLNGFAFETTTDLRVDSRLGPQYRSTAESIAAAVVSDGAAFARLVPCAPSDAGCPAEFIETFGERAFRRPLSDEELGRFGSLFDAGASLGETDDAFVEGVQIVVEAMLQAPQFLYRTEVSDGQIVDGRELLDDWEVASRLSYFIYDSMPDEELFEQARLGRLSSPSEVAAQVERMLDDDRATFKLASFHEQLWQFGRFSRIAPDPETYPNVPDDMVERVRTAASLFLEEVIATGGGLEEFLTAPYAFADAELAPLYDASVSGDGFSRVDFDAGERKGFMMQAGFLASNAYSVKTDPIHRGLFVLRDVLCREIPDPPPGAQMTPPPETDEPIITTRDEISLLTGQLYCPSCHSQINEPGFAFEGFDAIGQVRERENGVEVDTTGSITLDGADVPFDGAHELVDALAQSQDARDCYATRFVEFANGRVFSESDEPLRDELAAAPLGIRQFVARFASSPEFSSRDSSEEAAR